MSWLDATVTVPTVSLVSLAAWAALATALGGWHWLTYHRAPGGLDAPVGDRVPWDEPAPATTTTPATARHRETA